MVDQVEKVARALYEHEWRGQPFPDNFPVERGYWMEAARAAITAYNPNERLREALVALADAADKCTEAPHFIVQPFLNVYREHGETIALARTSPSGLRE